MNHEACIADNIRLARIIVLSGDDYTESERETAWAALRTDRKRRVAATASSDDGPGRAA